MDMPTAARAKKVMLLLAIINQRLGKLARRRAMGKAAFGKSRNRINRARRLTPWSLPDAYRAAKQRAELSSWAAGRTGHVPGHSVSRLRVS